jgi:hypothetical protein
MKKHLKHKINHSINFITLIFKTQRFEDWVLSQSSGGTYSAEF